MTDEEALRALFPKPIRDRVKEELKEKSPAKSAAKKKGSTKKKGA